MVGTLLRPAMDHGIWRRAGSDKRVEKTCVVRDCPNNWLPILLHLPSLSIPRKKKKKMRWLQIMVMMHEREAGMGQDLGGSPFMC